MARLLLLLLLLPVVAAGQSRPTAGRIMGDSVDPTGLPCNSTATITDFFIRSGVAVGSSIFVCRGGVYVLFAGGGGGSVGPGTIGTIPKFLTTTTIGDSLLTESGTELSTTATALNLPVASELRFGINEIAFVDTLGPVFTDGNINRSLRLNIQGLSATRTQTVPNANGTLALIDLAQTWTATQTFGEVVLGAANAVTWTGRAKITSPADSVFLLQNNAGSDFSMLKFGGTTSSFPALKRTGTNLGFRLADDSADAPMSAGVGVFSGGVTAPSFATNATSAGFIDLCEPTGTGSDCAKILAPASITTAYTLTLPAATAGSSLVSYTVASGTSALGTGAITSATCATVVTTAATGTATTDVVWWGFNGDPTAVTGYVPLTAGMLTIIAYPTANNVNFKVCNNTTSSITPGAITLNWRIVR